MIPLNILENYPYQKKKYTKNQLIFEEGGPARFYCQILEGHVKMYNLNEDGKEFVQGYFKNGQSFGEPPLFGAFQYPANAVALGHTTILQLPKKEFLNLLSEHPKIHLEFTANLCKRMKYKAMMVKEVSVYPPEHRILTLLNYLKTESGTLDTFEIKLTRQQLSELTGLRVETVIKVVKKLEKMNKLQIKERKIYV